MHRPHQVRVVAQDDPQVASVVQVGWVVLVQGAQTRLQRGIQAHYGRDWQDRGESPAQPAEHEPRRALGRLTDQGDDRVDDSLGLGRGGPLTILDRPSPSGDDVDYCLVDLGRRRIANVFAIDPVQAGQLRARRRQQQPAAFENEPDLGP